MADEVYMFPMSFAQERLWFLDELEPGSSFYNIASASRLTGELDVRALERSLNEIVNRHEILRTSFTSRNGRPTQVIQSGANVGLPVIDLRGLPGPEREAEARRAAARQAGRPFDLEKGPLIRAVLIRIDPPDAREPEHALMLTMHHIISDGWSMEVFIRELAALYGAHLEERPNPLPDLPIQYADYAQWQRDRLTGERLETLLRHWKKRLADAPAALELPADRPRPPVMTHRGGLETFHLPADLTENLRGVGREAGATLFMTLLAAYTALLSRYSGQEDIVVGAPAAGRDRPEVEPLIGLFVNTLPTRVDLSGNPPFPELLERVRETTLDAFTHQEIPFEKLVEALAPERNMGATPLFQVAFTLENKTADPPGLPGVALSPMPPAGVTSKFDLTLLMAETADGLSGALEYRADLFDRATITRMAGHFRTLLEGISGSPGIRLGDLPLLTGAERRLLLEEWNGAGSDYPRDHSVHALFEARASQAPDAPALLFEETRLTYGELNARANRLAHYLRRLEVGPGALVGVFLERSPETIVGLLAILKAGGAYVSLDASYPPERLRFMLEDARVPVMLSRAALLDRLPAHQARVVCLDRDREIISRESAENPGDRTAPDHLAYVSYTSGSTGKPKGVCIPHRAVARLVINTNFVDFRDTDVFLQFAPIPFDASTFEIWGALLNGARLAIPSPGIVGVEELGRVIRERRVTTLWLTAGLFHQMVDHQLEDLKSVRQLLAGGDVLSAPHVKKALDQLPGCTLINGYGPTENTTFTCCHPMTESAAVGASAPIGRPIANTRVYILDSRLTPTPIGIPGELYAAGEGLAKGYLNRPSLTAERFIPNPFRDGEGSGDEYLYKTGDVVRWRPDGVIEFFGRTDHQVKIRGFRVEPGEIEAALEAHPNVRQSVVTARPDPSGDKRLIAYIVGPAEPSRLRAHLRKKLPTYMIPAAFVRLEALPLNPNGKVDRNALPDPAPGAGSGGGEYTAPRTRNEEIMAGIWAEALALERVGIHDNFFEIGGHSLMASRIVSRLSEAFGVKPPLRSVFEDPTVAGLTRRVETIRWASGAEKPPGENAPGVSGRL
ncbi:MAG: amino acid adenylation domain-containing protein [Desulfobacterales bacterium]|nr:amino acid adenylation domain-containing protein [Desulfobacterales bacterium]